jgi:hypothetical protein
MRRFDKLTEDDLGDVLEIWAQNDVFMVVNLTILCEHALVMASMPRGQVAALKKRIEETGEVLRVVGSVGHYLFLEDLQAIKVTHDQAQIDFGYFDGKRRASFTAQFCQPVQRDVLAALQDRLPDGWTERTKPLPVRKAIDVQIWIGVLVLLFGVVGFFAVRENESGQKARDVRDAAVGKVIDSIGLGSWACLGVTVALLVGLGLWALYDIFNPTPNEIVLTRDGEEEEEE